MSTQLQHLDSPAITNIVARLPFKNALRLLYTTGCKRLLQATSAILKTVNLFDVHDHHCLVSLQKLDPISFDSILNLNILIYTSAPDIQIPMPPNLQWLDMDGDGYTLQNNIVCNPLQVRNRTHTAGFPTKNYQNAHTISYNFAARTYETQKNVERISVFYYLAHNIDIANLWPNARRLTIKDLDDEGLPQIISRQGFGPLVERFKLSSLLFNLQLLDNIPNMCQLKHLSITFSQPALNFDMERLVGLDTLKLEYIAISKLALPSLPPNLQVLYLHSISEVKFPIEYPSLRHVLTCSAELIKQADGTWWNLRADLEQNSTSFDRLLSRSTLLLSAFIKSPTKRRTYLSDKFVQWLFDIGRLDVAGPIFESLGTDFFWWRQLDDFQCNQRLELLPVNRYDINVLNQLRLCACRLISLSGRGAHNGNLNTLFDWMHQNQNNFDKQMWQNLTQMISWMLKDSGTTQSLPFRVKNSLFTNVARSFGCAFRNVGLNVEAMAIAFKMAKRPSFAKSCCEYATPSAWFDEHPLWRNVTILESALNDCHIMTSPCFDSDTVKFWLRSSDVAITVAQKFIRYSHDQRVRIVDMTEGREKSLEYVNDLAKEIMNKKME